VEAPITGDVWVWDNDGERKKLRKLEPSVGDRALGVQSAVDGSQDNEFEFRLQQAKTWADKARTGHIPRHLA